MIHVHSLVVVLSCVSFVTSFQEPTSKDLTCARENYDKPCQTACSFDDNAKKWCCQITRCTKCWKDTGLKKCEAVIEERVQLWILKLTDAWERRGCQANEKYPSIRCLYIFYEVWFYVVPILISLLLAAIIAYVIIRKRRKRLAKKEEKRLTKKKKNSNKD